MIRKRSLLLKELVGVMLASVIFGIPFYFVLNNASKNQLEASLMNLARPENNHLLANITEVLAADKGIVVTAFKNSFLLTLFSVIVLVVFCSMAGFVSQRRTGRMAGFVNKMILTGLILPPAIVPTIWLLNTLGIYKTMFSMVMIEAALRMAFATMLYKAFMATIPREIDEAAIIDGCGPFGMYLHVIFPLLQPVTSTVIVLSVVNIFNDFVNPLYFFPGAKNITVQLTLYNFMSKYLSSWNLLFSDVLIITIPPLIIFIIFNKKIIAGMSAGAVKG
jgi:raffinose/stachyose/melibiose transport system permease protein